MNLNDIKNFVLDLDVGIFIGRRKKQKLLRERKIILLKLLETNKKILKLVGEDKVLEDEIKELERIIYY